MKRIKFNQIKIKILTFCYLLMSSYFFIKICDHFDFVPGYQCIAPSTLKIAISIFLASIPIVFLPLSGSSPNNVVLWVLYYSHIVPSILMYPLIVNDGDFIFPLAISIFFAGIILISQRIKWNITEVKFKNHWFGLLLIALVFISTVYINLSFGINFTAPSIYDVYGVRSEYQEEIIKSGSILAGYIVIVSGFVFSSFSLVFGIRLYKQNKIMSCVYFGFAVWLSFSIFSATGFKSVAFAPLVVLLFYVAGKWFENYSNLIAVGIPLISLVGFLFSRYFDVDVGFYHWYRRVFMVPGMNANYFYDYMSIHGIYHLSGAPQAISEYYYRTFGSANAGLMGDGYAKFGYIGLLLNSGLLIGTLVLIKSISRNIDPRVSCPLILPIAYAMSNSALTSVFFTYGLLFYMLFLFVGSWQFKK